MNNVFVIIVLLMGNLGASEASLKEENYLAAPSANEFLSRAAFHPFHRVVPAIKVVIDFTPVEEEEEEEVDGQDIDTKMTVQVTPLYPFKKRVWRWDWLRACCVCCCGRPSDD